MQKSRDRSDFRATVGNGAIYVGCLMALYKVVQEGHRIDSFISWSIAIKKQGWIKRIENFESFWKFKSLVTLAARMER